LKIYLISDTHFNHKNILGYTGRPYNDINEMNSSLIKNWNNIIKKGDIVYHLGDFAFGNKDVIKHLTSQLNGRKFLICGNHDSYRPSQYMEMGFEWASRHSIIYDGFWIFSHEPMFLEANSPFANCYGHLHQNNYSGPNNNYFNCSVEQIEYKPIAFDEIKKIIKKRD